MAKLGGKFDLSALKRCHLGSDGGPWYISLQDYIKGTEVVHHLDPWHINRMVQGAFPLKATRNRAYKLLYAGDIGPLIGYLAQKAVQDTRSRVKVK